MNNSLSIESKWSPGDYIFIFFFGFLLGIIIFIFRKDKIEISKYSSDIVETIIFSVMVVGLVYYLLKMRSFENYSYLVQDQFLFLGLLVFFLLLGLILVLNIYKDRKSPSGFIIMIISISIVLIALLIILSNNALNIRYDLKSPNLTSALFASRFKPPKKRNINMEAIKLFGV